MTRRILCGGSPCTHWSIAQSKNRETKAEGLGWELFKNYLIAKEKFKPDFFFYENNKSAAPAIKEQIAFELGEDLMYVNSSLVSAQNRERFYVFNWEAEQPEDRGIILRDILEDNTSEKGYALEAPQKQSLKVLNVNPSGKGMNGDVIHTNWKSRTLTTNKGEGQKIITPIRIGTIENTAKTKKHDSQAYRVYSSEGKSVTIVGNGGGMGAKTGLYATPVKIGHYGKGGQGQRIYSINGKSVTMSAQTGGLGGTTGLYAMPIGYRTMEDELGKFKRYEAKISDKSNAITTVPSDSMIAICAPKNSEHPIYEVKDGLITIKDKTYQIKLPDGYYIIRKLTPLECERLQTMPDNYTSCVSNSQRYKCLGNGWTAEVVKHLWEYGIGKLSRDTPLEVLSMYDGIATARYVLEQMGFKNIIYKSYEIDKYAIQVAQDNYPNIIQCGDAFQLRNGDWTY